VTDASEPHLQLRPLVLVQRPGHGGARAGLARLRAPAQRVAAQARGGERIVARARVHAAQQALHRGRLARLQDAARRSRMVLAMQKPRR
jgi:hypothetical protein